VSRVPTVFKVGDRVVWAEKDLTQGSDTNAIFSGEIQSIDNGAQRALCINLLLHSVESSAGFNTLAVAPENLVPLADLKKLSDVKWMQS